MALREQIKEAMHTDNRAVGLANNYGIRFKCGTCKYYEDTGPPGICRNKHPKLNGTKVDANWCCNLYDHEGMKVVIA